MKCEEVLHWTFKYEPCFNSPLKVSCQEYWTLRTSSPHLRILPPGIPVSGLLLGYKFQCLALLYWSPFSFVSFLKKNDLWVKFYWSFIISCLFSVPQAQRQVSTSTACKRLRTNDLCLTDPPQAVWGPLHISDCPPHICLPRSGPASTWEGLNLQKIWNFNFPLRKIHMWNP